MRADDGAMKHRHQRRALPAGRHVGLAEIVHHRNAEPLAPAPAPSPICTVSLFCGRWSTVWPWKPTTAMSPGAMPLLAPAAAPPPRHGSRVVSASASRDHARPRACGRSAPTASASAWRSSARSSSAIGPVDGRAEAQDALAVGLDQRGVDAVERGAAHQPDGTNRRHGRQRPRPLLNPAPDLLHHRRNRAQPMSAYKSDFLNVLASRGFIHQVSEPEALDAARASRSRSPPISASTAPRPRCMSARCCRS